GSEARHLASVRRLRPGDPVCLFNGDGHEYSAIVVACARKSVELNVVGVASPPRELPFHLEVAAPLPKGDRGQFLIEKLTELGVTAFVPLSTERSIVHPRTERLERYVIEASKQCGRNVLMRVESAVDWTSYCRREHLRSRKVLAHPAAEGPLPLADAFRSADGFTLAVGPEGGVTEAEL